MSMPHDTSFPARTHALESGARVRLRLARRSDVAAVRELLAARGVVATELEVRRAVGYDPKTRRVFCACATVDGREILVGVAAIDLRPGAEIDTLVVDEDAAPGVTALLGAYLEHLAAQSHRAA
jgi:hypothetical protein